MARRYPNQPRRHLGRRPDNRPSGAANGHGPRPPGFSHAAMRLLFDAVLPMKGKQFYNQATTGLVVGLGLGGAMVGGSWAGPAGAAIGLGVGDTAGEAFVERLRYYRR